MPLYGFLAASQSIYSPVQVPSLTHGAPYLHNPATAIPPGRLGPFPCAHSGLVTLPFPARSFLRPSQFDGFAPETLFTQTLQGWLLLTSEASALMSPPLRSLRDHQTEAAAVCSQARTSPSRTAFVPLPTT